MKKEIKNAVVNILNSIDAFEMDLESVNEDTPLTEAGLDSIALMTLVVYLEEQFEIVIDFPDDNIEFDFYKVSLRNIIEIVEKLIMKKDQL